MCDYVRIWIEVGKELSLWLREHQVLYTKPLLCILVDCFVYLSIEKEKEKKKKTNEEEGP